RRDCGCDALRKKRRHGHGRKSGFAEPPGERLAAHKATDRSREVRVGLAIARDDPAERACDSVDQEAGTGRPEELENDEARALAQYSMELAERSVRVRNVS